MEKEIRERERGGEGKNSYMRPLCLTLYPDSTITAWVGVANKPISIMSQECHINEFFTHALSRSKIKEKINQCTKFAYWIDGKGHINRFAKVVDLYTSSDACGHSQSSQFVILEVVLSDVAITANKETIVEEEVEDDAMLSRASAQEGTGEADGGCGRPARRVKREVMALEDVCHKLGSNIGKNGLSVEGLRRERVVDDDNVHVLDDQLWVDADWVNIRETIKGSHHSGGKKVVKNTGSAIC